MQPPPEVDSFSNLSADFGTDTLLALEHTPELLQNAVLVNTAQPKDTRKGETNVHTFFAAVNGENGTEPVKITVKEYADKPGNTPPKNILAYFKAQKASKDYNTLYDLKALEVVGIESAKKEFGASASAANGETPSGAKSTPNSTISVANLLGLVKGDAEKYIPKNPQSINAVDPGATPKADSVGTSMNGIPRNGVGVNGNSVNQEPGIKGTGAAEQNFTGKADYQSLLTDDNTQRDRPGDVRPMEVPKQDAHGRKVSEFVGNAYGAEVTPDRMANAIESLVQDGKLGFESRSNKQSLENARQSILAKRLLRWLSILFWSISPREFPHFSVKSSRQQRRRKRAYTLIPRTISRRLSKRASETPRKRFPALTCIRRKSWVPSGNPRKLGMITGSGYLTRF